MSKSAPRLTPIQVRALDFIRSSVDQNGTAPTLRELCSHMGYSAIGSAQDLVASLRRKGFLSVPSKQCARSLVLTQRAQAIHEPTQPTQEDTFIIPCYDDTSFLHSTDPSQIRMAHLRISVSMFSRPYPNISHLFGFKNPDASMLDAGFMKDDWLIVKISENGYFLNPFVGKVVLIELKGQALVRTLDCDRDGFMLLPANTVFESTRLSEDDDFKIIGTVIAMQRILD